MTVHAIEIVTATSRQTNPDTVPSPDSPDFAADLIEQRLQENVLGTHTEAVSDQASPVTENTPAEGGTAHFRGRRRFDLVSDKTTLLDDIEQQVVADAEWYEIRYHSCPHDEADGGSCPDWTTERSYGTVPSDL